MLFHRSHFRCIRCRTYDALCEWDDELDDEVKLITRKRKTLSLEESEQEETRLQMTVQRLLRDSLQQKSSPGPENAMYEALVARIEDLEARRESEMTLRHRMIQMLGGSEPATDTPVAQGPSKRRRPAA